MLWQIAFCLFFAGFYCLLLLFIFITAVDEGGEGKEKEYKAGGLGGFKPEQKRFYIVAAQHLKPKAHGGIQHYIHAHNLPACVPAGAED